MPNPNLAPGSRLAQAGAAAYVIWALLHVQASWAVYQVAQAMPDGMPRARVIQDAWNLLCFSGIALVAAVVLNWRNDVRGWWINLVVVSAVDVGFVLIVLIPGHLPLWPGLAGPLFWILGIVLSSLALRRGRARYGGALSGAGS